MCACCVPAVQTLSIAGAAYAHLGDSASVEYAGTVASVAAEGSLAGVAAMLSRCENPAALVQRHPAIATALLRKLCSPGERMAALELLQEVPPTPSVQVRRGMCWCGMCRGAACRALCCAVRAPRYVSYRCAHPHVSHTGVGCAQATLVDAGVTAAVADVVNEEGKKLELQRAQALEEKLRAQRYGVRLNGRADRGVPALVLAPW